MAEVTRKKHVDWRCLDLAEHFLRDVKGATDAETMELAENIQPLCEDFCAKVDRGDQK